MVKLIPSVVIFVAMLAFAQQGWSAEPAMSVWDSAAIPDQAKSPKPAGDSASAREKAPKPDAKGASVKPNKATADTSSAKAQTAKVEPPKTAEDFKKVGDQFVKKGQTDKAMAAYKQCIEKAGDDTAYGKIVRMVADYCHAKKQYADAARYYSMVKGKAREQLPFQIMFGRSLQMSGKNAEAIDLLEPLMADLKIKIDSRKEMMKILGDAYFRSDMNEKAVAWYGKYLKAGGTKTGDMVFLVASSQESSAPLKAKLLYEQNIKSFPADYRNYLHLGIMLAKNKATMQRSAALIKKASDLAGSVPAAWLAIGKTYGRVGKTDEELKAYQMCLRLDTGNLQAKIRIGTILLGKNMIVDAITLLEQAHKQAPDSSGPMASLASAYMKTGKTKDAIELLVKAKTAKPKDAAIRKLLFEAYRANGQDQQALEEIKAAIELKRDNESLLAYGKLLLKSGKLDEAANTMEDIRSTAPDNVEALMTLAMIFRGQNKSEEAIELYKEVSSIDGKAAAPLYERAEVYMAQNKVKWAEQFYQRALEADPKMAVAQLGLAKIALAHNNRQAYLDMLDKAASMDPDNPLIKKELENSRKSGGK